MCAGLAVREHLLGGDPGAVCGDLPLLRGAMRAAEVQ